MATHPILIKRLGDALAGRPLGLQLEQRVVASGSYNYGSMSMAYLDLDAENREDAHELSMWDEAWTHRLAEQEEIGILAHQGPQDMQIEQGAPAPHDGMNMLPVLAIWRSAARRRNNRLADLCERNVAAQLRYRFEFSERGLSCPPCLRAKSKDDPSNGSRIDQWQSRLLDRLQKILDGHSRGSWDANTAEAILAEMLASVEGPSRRERMRAAAFPRIAVPIHRVPLGGGRWLAWLAPEGGFGGLLDPLTWVSFGPDLSEPVLGYGDAAMPDVPEGVEPHIYRAG